MAKDFDTKINTRVKEIRKALKLTQAQFSYQLETQQSYYSEIERGNREVNSRILQSLIVIFNISSDWLITGKGEMFKPKESQFITEKEQENWDLIKKNFRPQEEKEKYSKPLTDIGDFIAFYEAMESNKELNKVLSNGSKLEKMSQRFDMFVKAIYSEIVEELLNDFILTYKRRTSNAKFFEQNKDKINHLVEYSRLIDIALIDFKKMLNEIKEFDKNDQLSTWFGPQIFSEEVDKE